MESMQKAFRFQVMNMHKGYNNRKYRKIYIRVHMYIFVLPDKAHTNICIYEIVRILKYLNFEKIGNYIFLSQNFFSEKYRSLACLIFEYSCIY